MKIEVDKVFFTFPTICTYCEGLGDEQDEQKITICDILETGCPVCLSCDVDLVGSETCEIKANHLEIKTEHEYTTILNALHRYGNFAYAMWSQGLQDPTIGKAELDQMEARKDSAFRMQERLRESKTEF